jgi:hypothetical protein
MKADVVILLIEVAEDEEEEAVTEVEVKMGIR